nr:MAG TPA: replisome organizer [Crassvirales sp.]
MQIIHIPKNLYKKFQSNRVAQFFLYLLFSSDDNGMVRKTIRQMAADNDISTRKVLQYLSEIKTLKACTTEGRGSVEICNYPFYIGAQTNASQKTNLSYDFVENEYKDAFFKWLEFKRGCKKMYKTQSSLQTCYNHLKKISNNNPSLAMQIVEESIANNWAGLYARKENKKDNINLKNMKYDSEW